MWCLLVIRTNVHRGLLKHRTVLVESTQELRKELVPILVPGEVGVLVVFHLGGTGKVYLLRPVLSQSAMIQGWLPVLLVHQIMI